MRSIDYCKVVEAVKGLCISACHELGDDVLGALRAAAENESDAGAVRVLNLLIENAQIARTDMIPLCQDTGLAVVFVEQGSDVVVEGGGTVYDAINEGVSCGYEEGYLRKSVVAEPLNERKNTETNTPAIIHYSVVPGESLKISFMAKGGGSENKSQFRMFNPTATSDEVIDWITQVAIEAGANACPPFVVGVGIGGNFELSCIMSKRSLLRKIGEHNGDEFYADVERRTLEKINASGLGPQGLGGDTTALWVTVETAGCHIASLPVAVNIECHSHRHKTVVL